MARNPLAESKYITILQAIDTSGANPAATTISAVRQIRRIVSLEMWLSTAGDPTHEARVSSGTDMLGNIVYIHTTLLNGTANAVTNNFWVTVEVE